MSRKAQSSGFSISSYLGLANTEIISRFLQASLSTGILSRYRVLPIYLGIEYYLFTQAQSATYLPIEYYLFTQAQSATYLPRHRVLPIYPQSTTYLPIEYYLFTHRVLPIYPQSTTYLPIEYYLFTQAQSTTYSPRHRVLPIHLGIAMPHQTRKGRATIGPMTDHFLPLLRVACRADTLELYVLT